MFEETNARVYQILRWPQYMDGQEILQRYKSQYGTNLDIGSMYGSLRLLQHDGLIEILMPKRGELMRKFRRKAGGRRMKVPKSLEERTDEGFSGEFAQAHTISIPILK